MTATTEGSVRRRWTVAEVRARTYKPRDAWWTVVLVDPLASRLVTQVANRTRLTPDQLTVAALGVGLASAAAFWFHSWTWLVVGAALYHLSFTLDCMDGKLARLTGAGSPAGGLLDYIFDRIRVLAVTVGLFGGQFRATGHARYLYLGIVVLFLDALRYLDALQAAGVHREMRLGFESLRPRVAAAMVTLDALTPTAPDAAVLTEAVTRTERLDARLAALVDPPAGEGALHTEFNQRLPWYPRLRRAMMRRRIRTHLVSGVELQMFVFVIGALVDEVLSVTIAAAALMAVFEVGIFAKVIASAHDYQRLHRGLLVEADAIDAAISALAG